MTLTFISIEAARAALLEIPSSSLVGGPAPEAAEPKPAKAPKAEKAPAPAPVPTPPAEVVEAPKPEPVATTSSPKPSESVDYPTLQKAVFALASKSRDAAAAVAATMSVKTFKELAEARWGEALVAVNAKLAELEAA